MRSRRAANPVHEPIFKSARNLIPSRRRKVVRWLALVPEFLNTA